MGLENDKENNQSENEEPSLEKIRAGISALNKKVRSAFIEGTRSQINHLKNTLLATLNDNTPPSLETVKTRTDQLQSFMDQMKHLEAFFDQFSANDREKNEFLGLESEVEKLKELVRSYVYQIVIMNLDLENLEEHSDKEPSMIALRTYLESTMPGNAQKAIPDKMSVKYKDLT